MKCLLISDLHYTLKQFDWVSNVAKDYDVVVIAGDHLDISSTVENPERDSRQAGYHSGIYQSDRCGEWDVKC